VIGVDASPEMLELARVKVPEGEFLQADLERVPLPDDHVDLVVCGLALVHARDLAPVLAELVRVLRPGGHLVISDQRGLIPGIAGVPVSTDGQDGSPAYVPVRVRLASEYLAAALPLGLQVRRCEEPKRPSPLVAEDGTDLHDDTPKHVPGAAPNVWALHPWAPDCPN
jgi:ubiquinone/menaquinone biosynthesis C-methylase UbiE